MLASAFAMAVPAVALADQAAGTTFKVNGKAVSGTYLSGGRTFVDIAAFSKATGFTYTLAKDGKAVTLGGQTLPVELRNGVPFAPARALADAAGAAGLAWDRNTKSVDMLFDVQLSVFGDTVSHLGLCMVTTRFAVGDSIIFRMKAINPITGELEKDAKLQVHLSTGEVLDMQLGQHPPGVPNAESFWSVRYDVTEATPLGTLNFFVTAESAIGSGEFKPISVTPTTIVSAAEAPEYPPMPPMPPMPEGPPAPEPAPTPAHSGGAQ